MTVGVRGSNVFAAGQRIGGRYGDAGQRHPGRLPRGYRGRPGNDRATHHAALGDCREGGRGRSGRRKGGISRGGRRGLLCLGRRQQSGDGKGHREQSGSPNSLPPATAGLRAREQFAVVGKAWLHGWVSTVPRARRSPHRPRPGEAGVVEEGCQRGAWEQRSRSLPSRYRRSDRLP